MDATQAHHHAHASRKRRVSDSACVDSVGFVVVGSDTAQGGASQPDFCLHACADRARCHVRRPASAAGCTRWLHHDVCDDPWHIQHHPQHLLVAGGVQTSCRLAVRVLLGAGLGVGIVVLSGVAFHKGYVASKNSEWSSAIIHFTKAIELDPTYINAYNHRGFGFSKQEKISEAIADFTKAIDLAPKYADAYYNRGIAYAKQQKFTEAIADFTKTIELDSKHADAYFNRGDSYKALDKNMEAEADFAKAKELRK